MVLASTDRCLDPLFPLAFISWNSSMKKTFSSSLYGYSEMLFIVKGRINAWFFPFISVQNSEFGL